MIQETDLRLHSLEEWRRDRLDLSDTLVRLEDRIARSEPRIHALVWEPARFDRLRREVETLAVGPLHGVPFGVKDIFHVDGLPTLAGSRLPAVRLQGPEADSVRRLREAGGFVLGKTVSTEFAYFAPGPTRNPRHPGHTPGGSSSGSAAAVAAGLCPLALGTQTIGSISRPAAFCGVVGFKPTYGRISTAGVIPLSPSLDHVGTFTANLDDAIEAAALLCRDWRAVEWTARPVLGVPTGPYLERASAAGRAHFRAVRRLLAAAGFEIVEAPALIDLEEIEARHQLILAAEAARVHEHWYSEFKHLYHPQTAGLIERGRSIAPAALDAALPGRQQLREALNAVSDREGIDLWISPAAPGPAPAGLESTGDPIMNLPWTHAGLPTVSLPAESDPTGLPMGLQVTGGWCQDERLLGGCRELATALVEMS